MTASPHIHSLFIADIAGAPMKKIDQARIIAGQGIAGDRYALGIGAFSKTKPKIRHITLISLSGIADANRQLQFHQHPIFAESETRRNVVIENFSSEDLNHLVGKIFYLGGLAFKGTELCVPCKRPSNLLGTPGFIQAFVGRGGIRAAALDSGTLAAGCYLSI